MVAGCLRGALFATLGLARRVAPLRPVRRAAARAAPGTTRACEPPPWCRVCRLAATALQVASRPSRVPRAAKLAPWGGCLPLLGQRCRRRAAPPRGSVQGAGPDAWTPAPRRHRHRRQRPHLATLAHQALSRCRPRTRLHQGQPPRQQRRPRHGQHRTGWRGLACGAAKEHATRGRAAPCYCTTRAVLEISSHLTSRDRFGAAWVGLWSFWMLRASPLSLVAGQRTCCQTPTAAAGGSRDLYFWLTLEHSACGACPG